MLRQASRNDRIAPFHVMALLGRAQALQAAGHDVIHLEVGEPDFPTPAPILAAGQRALAAGLTDVNMAIFQFLEVLPLGGLAVVAAVRSVWHARAACL